MVFENGPMKVGISLSISAERRCSTVTKGMYKGSLLTRITNGSAIFHWTVLEGYWELEARTGTRMIATTRSFGSFRLFLHEVTPFIEKFEKL